MKTSGKLISIEGIDFAGKTTQVALLVQALEKKGYQVCSFKFPDSRTDVGALLYSTLWGNVTMSTHAMLALFSVNRLERKDEIESAWSCGSLVVFDRYSESEYAYGVGKGLPGDWLLALESQMPFADIVIVLDLDPDLALQRTQQRQKKDFFETSSSFLSTVRQNYLSFAQRPPRTGQRWDIVDANQSISVVHKIILQKILEILN